MRPGGAVRVALALLLPLAGCHHRQPAPLTLPPPPPVLPAERQANPRAQTLSQPVVHPPSTKGLPDSVEVGLASWYGPPYHNRKGADGTLYDENAMTAAHRTLPLGSMVRVTNLSNSVAVEVRITDRGPFVPGRIIDLSLAAAKLTGVYRAGIAKVRVEAFLPLPRAGVDPGGRWCVQVGAFLSAEDATVLRHELQARYSTARVIEFAGPTGYWVRLNAKLADKATATQIASRIHVPEAEAYVVRTD